jgi:hypothetical protein
MKAPSPAFNELKNTAIFIGVHRAKDIMNLHESHVRRLVDALVDGHFGNLNK